MIDLTDQETEWAELVCAVIRGQVEGQVPVVLRAEWEGRSVVVLAACSEEGPDMAVQPLAILTDKESALALRPSLAQVGVDV